MKVKLIDVAGKTVTVKQVSAMNYFKVLINGDPEKVIRACLSEEDQAYLDELAMDDSLPEKMSEVIKAVIELKPFLFKDNKKKEVSGESSTGVLESSDGNPQK